MASYGAGVYYQDKLDRITKMLQNYPNDSLTTEEVMRLLNVKYRRVEALRTQGVIPSYALDPHAARKDWRFSKVDLTNYLLNTLN